VGSKKVNVKYQISNIKYQMLNERQITKCQKEESFFDIWILDLI